jgi:predicted phage tail protein
MITKERTVFGRGGGGKGDGGGTQQRQPIEDPNSLQSRSIARFLDVWCEGPIEGLVNADKSIYLDDTPLMNPDGTFNFSGVSWAKVLGYPFGVQQHVPGFPDSANTVSVGGGNGVKVTHSGGGVTQTITNDQANAVTIKLTVPAFVQQFPQSGDVRGVSVGYHIDVKPNGGTFSTVYNGAFVGKCTSPYQRDHRISLPAGGAPWQVRVVRDTGDNFDDTIQNDFYWTSYTEIIDAKFAYPNTAYVGIQIDTAQFTGGAPARSYDLKGLIIKIPSNYDPDTRNYTGAWDGTFTTAYSNNPAWCLYDLLTNDRYGLGLPTTAVDPFKWDLYTIGQYCDGVDANGNFVGVDDGAGSKEPRYQCNMILNSRQEAYAVINTMVSIFRGMAYWSAGAIRITADMPKTPVKIFNNSNVVNGEFKYEGTALKARHTVAKVVWNDPSDSYRAKVEFVEDAEGINKYGVRTTDIVAYGATTRGQAIRTGKWLLDTEKTSTETVTFRSGLEAADALPGDIIYVADDNYAGRVFGGRTVVPGANSITIDQPITLQDGNTYTLQIMMPDGTISSRVLTNNLPANADVLTWSDPLFALPLSGAVWVVTATTLNARQFMVVSNVEASVAQFELTAVFYDPSKFDRVESGIVVPPLQYSITPTGAIAQPVSLNAVPRLYTNGTSVHASAILSWQAPEDSRVFLYEIQVKGPADPTWVPVGTTSLTSAEYQDTVEGAHSFRVRSKALNDKFSNWTQIDNVILTTAVPPSDVAGVIEVDDSHGLSFRWTPNTDLNLDHYEIRRGSSWDTAVLKAKQAGTTFLENGVPAGTYTYWIKAVSIPNNANPSGVYSADATSITLMVNASGIGGLSSSLTDTDYTLSWSSNAGTFAIDHYEIRVGSTWASGSLLATTKATKWQATVTWGATQTFWVAAIDTAGNAGTPASTSITISTPTAVTGLNVQVIDNNVLIRWGAATGSIPIDHYEVRKGSTWASASNIGDKSGTFTSVFETTGGTFTYWVAGIDTAGNVGTPASVSALVNQPPDFVFRANQVSTFSGTKTNLTVSGGALFGPYIAGQTWQSHFTSQGWTTPQDQINAGYPIYIQPVPTTAQYVETFDFGTSIDSTMITVNLTAVDSSGSVGKTITISTSPDNTIWTTFASGNQAFGTNFRYVKVTIDFTSDGKAATDVTQLEVILSAKLRTDTGSVSALASDSGGTVVNFNLDFMSVITIHPSLNTTSNYNVVYDFVSVPHPTSFKVLVFDTSGTRVNATVTWTARGY